MSESEEDVSRIQSSFNASINPGSELKSEGLFGFDQAEE